MVIMKVPVQHIAFIKHSYKYHKHDYYTAIASVFISCVLRTSINVLAFEKDLPTASHYNRFIKILNQKYRFYPERSWDIAREWRWTVGDDAMPDVQLCTKRNIHVY